MRIKASRDQSRQVSSEELASAEPEAQANTYFNAVGLEHEADTLCSLKSGAYGRRISDLSG
jgi:hypothetical protein